MFGRVRPHDGEITLSALPDLPRDAQEIARFWVTSERSFVAVARPREWTPELLGSLLVECLHTAAATYACDGAMAEEEALDRLWDGLDQERARLRSTNRSEDLH
jgi:hypothetical protein